MQRISAGFLFVTGFVLAFGVPSSANGANPQQPDKSKSRLREVLVLETREDVTEVDRRRELNPTSNPDVAVDADWWQSGFVKTGAGWKPSETSLDGNAVLIEEYRSIRSATPKTAADQLKLANWCRTQKLADQERAHLTQVLALSDGSADLTPIYKRMGYRRVGENWLSPAEFQEQQQQSRRISEQLRQWQPEMERIIRNWGANSRQRKLAQEELDGIKDSTAIPALLVAARTSDSLAQAICDRLESIPSFEASQALASIAVESDWPGVRQVATKKLKDRRIDDVAPALLSGMHTPYKTVKSSNVNLEQRLIFREDENRYVVTDLKFTPYTFEGLIIYSRRLNRIKFSTAVNPLSPTDAARQIEDTDYQLQQRVDDENDRIEEFNRRAANVLAELSGQHPCTNPKYWWAWWHIYTGTQPVPKQCTVYHGKVVLPITGCRVICCSCLVAGTPILTDRGFVAVEQIEIGDRVVAKDVSTGEIACKPVLHTTTRQPVPIKKFAVGESIVSASEGHHFWVSGHGWAKTRELKSGQPVHTATGMSRVESIEDEAQPAPVYNLVVADFHTYFVGPSLVLSHDVLQPALTNAKVPGLDAE